MLIGNMVGTTLAGIAVTMRGRFTPFAIIGTILTSIGGDPFTLFNTKTISMEWIGYYVLVGFGIGIGVGWQQPIIAVMADAPTATAAITFAQTIGGSIFVIVAQAQFSNKLAKELATRPPTLDPSEVLRGGASDLVRHVPERCVSAVLMSYNSGLTSAFFVGTMLVACSAIVSIFVAWTSIKGPVPAAITA